MHEKVKNFSNLFSPPTRLTSRGSGKAIIPMSGITLFFYHRNYIDVFEEKFMLVLEWSNE